MSFEAILWAMKDAPTANVNEFAVLAVFAEAANPDGCDVWLSKATTAEMTHLDQGTIRRTLRQLEKRSLIARGNQGAVSHIPRNYRPIVYDLMIPASWFGVTLPRINEYRARLGLKPITADDRGDRSVRRPDLGAAPARRRRSDAKSEGSSSSFGGFFQPSLEGNQGGLLDPPEGSSSLPGGVYKTRSGGLVDRRGGLVDPQTCPEPFLEPTDLFPSSVVEVTVPGARAEDGRRNSESAAARDAERERARAVLRRITPPPALTPLTPGQLEELVPLVMPFLAEPFRWERVDLLAALAERLPDKSGRLYAVLHNRLTVQLHPDRVPDDGGLWAHERPATPAPVLRIDCAECQRPMPGGSADGLCVGCRAELLAATAALVDVDQADAEDAAVERRLRGVERARRALLGEDLVLADVGQLPGQLGVPLPEEGEAS